jgi:hypothetical protein
MDIFGEIIEYIDTRSGRVKLDEGDLHATEGNSSLCSTLRGAG